MGYRTETEQRHAGVRLSLSLAESNRLMNTMKMLLPCCLFAAASAFLLAGQNAATPVSSSVFPTTELHHAALANKVGGAENSLGRRLQRSRGTAPSSDKSSGRSGLSRAALANKVGGAENSLSRRLQRSRSAQSRRV